MNTSGWFVAGVVGLVVVILSIYANTLTKSSFSPEPSPLPPNQEQEGVGVGPIFANYAVVRVFYATDRNRKPGAESANAFGNSRAILSFGYCDVSIPRAHRVGALETPSILDFEFREDPEKHIVLIRTVARSKDDFFRDINAGVGSSKGKNAFVFIHGYNVSFADAARRTAQIAYDLAFDGAPVFYSWPSQGETAAYTVDEQNIEWAQSDLRGFIEDFIRKSEAKNIYLIANSMGNRALTRAVASLLVDTPHLRSRIKEIILTAPDIDADVFKRDIVPALIATVKPITLYASSKPYPSASGPTK